MWPCRARGIRISADAGPAVVRYRVTTQRWRDNPIHGRAARATLPIDYRIQLENQRVHL
jgi:hypothetical protein